MCQVVQMQEHGVSSIQTPLLIGNFSYIGTPINSLYNLLKTLPIESGPIGISHS